MVHAQRENAVIAAEFEKRLTCLLEDRFGARQGSLLQRANEARLYLPADLARRLREMVKGIADLRSGASAIDPLVFRASAEAALASLNAPSIRRATERRKFRDRLRSALVWLLLLSPVICFGLFTMCFVLRIPWDNGTGALFAAMLGSAYLFWPSFLYWAFDRAVTNGATASAGRGVARALAFAVFFWAVGAWIVAIYNVSRENREEERREGRDDMSTSESPGTTSIPIFDYGYQGLDYRRDSTNRMDGFTSSSLYYSGGDDD